MAAVFTGLFVWQAAKKFRPATAPGRISVPEALRSGAAATPDQAPAIVVKEIPPAPASEAGPGEAVLEWINLRDEASLMNEETKGTVEHYIRLTRERSNVEALVATVPALEGKDVQTAAKTAFWQWEMPSTKKHRTILLFVAAKERAAYLVIGDELKILLNDSQAEQLLKSHFYHPFLHGNNLGAFWDTIATLTQVLSGERPPPGTKLSDEEAEKWRKMNSGGKVFLTGFLSLFIAVGFFILGYNWQPRRLGLILWGAGFGGIPLLAFDGPLLTGGVLLPVVFHAALAAAACYWGYRWFKKSS